MAAWCIGTDGNPNGKHNDNPNCNPNDNTDGTLDCNPGIHLVYMTDLISILLTVNLLWLPAALAQMAALMAILLMILMQP